MLSYKKEANDSHPATSRSIREAETEEGEREADVTPTERNL